MSFKIVSISLLLTHFISEVHAQQKSHIVCSRKNDPIIWNWATDKNGNYIEVTGYNLYGRCDDTNYNKDTIPNNGQLMFFVLNSQSVSIAKSACPTGYNFQPVQSSPRVWYRFAEGENNIIKKIYDGYHKCLTSIGKYEEEVEIYCSNKTNKSDFYWATASDQFRNFRIKVAGEWKTVDENQTQLFNIIGACSKEKIFVIRENKYLKVKEACSKNFFSQPASSYINPNFYRFAIKSRFGIRILPGYTSAICTFAPSPRVG
jgi:hypothetical protein